MRCEASIRITLTDRNAVATAKALEGLEGELKKRTKSNILIEKNAVIIKVSAGDVVALRASINGYLRQLQAIEAVEEK